MVAEAFLPNPENKPLVHHKNFNKLDNNKDNLVWLTYEEHNKIHAQHRKKKPKEEQERGEDATIQ